MGHYRFIEEIALADCAIDIDGVDLRDLFETAADALAELMVDPATVRRTVQRTIALDATELDLLLYDWLSELIFRKDRDGEVYTDTAVEVSGDGPFRVAAQLTGGRLDPTHVELRSDPKAVTLHQFGLERTDRGWHARIVIDI
jgi:SHS2 domain-containing protein